MNALKLFLVHFRTGALNELQYRVNFFIQLLQSFIALGVGLVGLSLVFTHTTELNGWSRPELLAVMGVHILMGGLINAFIQPNMQRLLDDIRQGTLDFALTKPADAQVLVSVREFRVWRFVDVAMGVIVLGVAAFELQTQMGALQALSFVAALLLGGVMIYAFWLMLTSIAFWVIRVDEMINLFEGVYAAGRWPVGIYPDWLRTGLTFLVPVAFAVTVPAEALTGRLTWQTLLGAALLAAALLTLARWVWRRGLRAYSGASA
jgi:ABC-2 type transport system permease protein